MATKIVRALVTALLGITFFSLFQVTIGSAFFSPYLNGFTTGVSSHEYINNFLRPLRATYSSIGNGKTERLHEKDPSMAFLYEPIPRRNFSKFANRGHHNTNDSLPYAYATLLCTREPDMRDPFFAATQSLVWRLLWSDWHGKYPVIVYVCPFTPKSQRDILRGQGALVKEIGLLDHIVPAEKVPLARWQDQFSKLNMWKETDYERIAYLDVDALPVANIDDIFDIIPDQSCTTEKLSPQDNEMMERDENAGREFCEYVFAGVDPYGLGEINGGLLVFKPNLLMYEKLIRGAKMIDSYDLSKMEQGLLHSDSAFGKDGPFRAHHLPQVYNAVPDYYITHRDGTAEESDAAIRVIHDKIWSAFSARDREELNMRWDLDWMAMCRFYDSPAFESARETGRLKEKLEIFLDALSEDKND